MIESDLRKLWGNLQAKKLHLPHFLQSVHLHGLRGIKDLSVSFDYPVTVIAGGNATCKSTVLFAAACAYKVPGAGNRAFVPSTLFPDYRPRFASEHKDSRRSVDLDFHYSTPQGQQSMRWRRSKGWNRSYFRQKKGKQPERPVYLRTLSHLRNPAEVRGVLSMSRHETPPAVKGLTSQEIDFAQSLLPFEYSEVVDLTSDAKKSLLFAKRKQGEHGYSELHMSSGERALLRLAKELVHLNGALVLIDEVEAGLHPFAQESLMVALQRLALRRELQIIVTTHSSIVIKSVPENARIFLERDEHGAVELRPPYRDVVQDALYGRSREQLNVLCEDEVAEGILDGILNLLLPRLGMRRESVHIGRDTGASEFPTHAKAFRTFGMIDNVIFVLDGDARKTGTQQKIKDAAGRQSIPVVYLPGDDAPECWVWGQLEAEAESMAEALSVKYKELADRLKQINGLYSAASDKPADIAKSKLETLARKLRKDVPSICSSVARVECGLDHSAIRPVVNRIEDALRSWRGGT